MDREQAQVRLIKIARRAMLDAMLQYGVVVNYRSIRRVLPTTDAAHVRRDLAYLIGKGYIVRVNIAPNQDEDDREYVITSLGMEVAQRINVDPALEV